MGLQSKNFVMCGSNSDITGTIGEIIQVFQVVTGSLMIAFNVDESDIDGQFVKGQFISHSVSSSTSSTGSLQYIINYDNSRLRVDENIQLLVKSGSNAVWESVNNIKYSDYILSWNGRGVKGIRFQRCREIISESVSYDVVSINFSGSNGFFASADTPSDVSPFYYVREKETV